MSVLVQVLGWAANSAAIVAALLLVAMFVFRLLGNHAAADWAWDVIDFPLIVSNAAFAVASVLKGAWAGAVVSGAVALLLIWARHRRRKNRKRAAALIGAKSRALRDALVRKAREASKPRPVLRPVPGAAR